MKLFEFIGKANSEDNGNPSSVRMNVFIALIQWSVVITFGFIWVLGQYPEFILAYLGILATLTGGLLGLKVLQKSKEEKVDSQNQEPKPPTEG